MPGVSQHLSACSQDWELKMQTCEIGWEEDHRTHGRGPLTPALGMPGGQVGSANRIDTEQRTVLAPSLAGPWTPLS